VRPPDVPLHSRGGALLAVARPSCDTAENMFTDDIDTP
jgi:hypothetical protein